MGDVRDVGADLAVPLPRRGGSRPTRPGRAATAAAPASSRCSWSGTRPFWEVQNIGTARIFTSPGMFGGYPGATGLRPQHQAATTCSSAPQRGEAYPVADGDFDDPALMEIEGERDLQAGRFTHARAVRRRRPLPARSMKGGGGPGRPAAAAGRGGRARRRRGPPAAALRRVVYGVSRPRRAPATRRAASAAVADPRVVGAERERVLGRRPDRCRCKVDVRGVDAALAALGGRVPRLLGPAGGLRLRGRSRRPSPADRSRSRARSRRQSRAAEFLASSTASAARRRRAAAAAAAAGRSSAETLGDLLDEKLSRRAVKDIQSGYKDPDRFDKWIARAAGAGRPTTSRSCCRSARG